MSAQIKMFMATFVVLLGVSYAAKAEAEHKALAEALSTLPILDETVTRVTGQELAPCAPAAANVLVGCGNLAASIFNQIGLGTAIPTIIGSIVSPNGKQCLDAVLPLLRCIGDVAGSKLSAAAGLLLFPTQQCYLNLISAGFPSQSAADACGECCRVNPSTCSRGCFPQA